MFVLHQEEEMSMLGEITHLQTLTDDLKTLTMDPHKLPASSEQVQQISSPVPVPLLCYSKVFLKAPPSVSLQVIVDLKGSECTWSYQTPPSSPSTTVSRKSSMCRLVTMATETAHCLSRAPQQAETCFYFTLTVLYCLPVAQRWNCSFIFD